MDRRIFNGAGLLGGIAALVAGCARAAGTSVHRVAIQVSAAERNTQELALVAARNCAEYFRAKGEPFRIEIVAFGPGYAMVRNDISMVKGNIETLQKELGETIAFSACQNTRAAIAASMGKAPDEVVQVQGVVATPSGIARLVELQERGWSYIRP